MHARRQVSEMSTNAEGVKATGIHIHAKWRKLGVQSRMKPFSGVVDPERLILETILRLRMDPKMLSGMLAWLGEYGDLVNVKKLSAIAFNADPYLLAAVCECAVAHGADRRLSALCRKKRPPRKKGFLYPAMRVSPAMAIHVKENADKIFSKWGYYVVNTAILENAVLPRRRILAENENLAVRAFFGPNTRADVFSALMGQKSLTIRRLSQIAGLSYKPVYAEVQNLAKNKLVEARQAGRSFNIGLAQSCRETLFSLSGRHR